jgi:hypothetical protein
MMMIGELARPIAFHQSRGNKAIKVDRDAQLLLQKRLARGTDREMHMAA